MKPSPTRRLFSVRYSRKVKRWRQKTKNAGRAHVRARWGCGWSWGQMLLEKSASPRCRSTPYVGWTKYYNERRFHESLDHLTPKDVYLGQGEKIKKIREIIRQNSTNKRIFDNKILEQITTFAVVHFCLTTYNQSGNKKRTVYKHIRVDCWTGTRKTS